MQHDLNRPSKCHPTVPRLACPTSRVTSGRMMNHLHVEHLSTSRPREFKDPSGGPPGSQDQVIQVIPEGPHHFQKDFGLVQKRFGCLAINQTTRLIAVLNVLRGRLDSFFPPFFTTRFFNDLAIGYCHTLIDWRSRLFAQCTFVSSLAASCPPAPSRRTCRAFFLQDHSKKHRLRSAILSVSPYRPVQSIPVNP